MDTDWAALDAEWIESRRSEPLPRKLYRAPVGFGRAAGPRNHPPDKTAFLNQDARRYHNVSALTDREPLVALLPPGVELRGDPMLLVGMIWFRNCYFLGGRDYQALTINIPVTSHRSGSPVDGVYCPVEWHSLPDNVVTAREEIAYPALWADVSPPILRGEGNYTIDASWLGFRFFEMEFNGLKEVTVPAGARPPSVSILYKYIPTGYSDGADCSRLIENNMEEYYKGVGAVEGITVSGEAPSTTLAGSGSFRFIPARWEDMPSQYHIVNRLAALPVLEVRSATVAIRDSAPL